MDLISQFDESGFNFQLLSYIISVSASVQDHLVIVFFPSSGCNEAQILVTS